MHQGSQAAVWRWPGRRSLATDWQASGDLVALRGELVAHPLRAIWSRFGVNWSRVHSGVIWSRSPKSWRRRCADPGRPFGSALSLAPRGAGTRAPRPGRAARANLCRPSCSWHAGNRASATQARANAAGVRQA